MNWDGLDYIAAATLLAGGGLGFFLAVRHARSAWHYLAVAAAAGGAILLIWMQLAVGLVGSGAHPINQLMGLVLVHGIVGAILSRARASGMRTTMLVVAGTQLLFGSLGFILLTPEMYSDLFLVTTFFAGIWTASAFLFHLAYLKEQRA